MRLPILLAAAIPPVALALSAFQDPAPTTGTLVQIQVPQEEAPSHRVAVPRGVGAVQGFDGDAWAHELGVEDLDAREGHFERFLRQARGNREAIEWLRRTERDSSDRELAWTCRLLLRELHQNPFAGVLPGWSQHQLPQGIFDPQIGEMQEHLDTLFEDQGFWFHATPGQGTRLRLHNLQGGPGASGSASGQSMRLEVGPDGAKLIITEEVDGETDTREYEGESLEAILEANPELKDSVGVLDSMRFRHDSQTGASPWTFYGPGDDRGQRFLFRRSQPGQAQGSGSVRTDVLGVYPGELDDQVALRLGIDPGSGLYVHQTEPGTIAHLLGLSAGAVLLEINGIAIQSRDDLSHVLSIRPADGELNVVWVDAWGHRRSKTWRPEAE